MARYLLVSAQGAWSQEPRTPKVFIWGRSWTWNKKVYI